MPAYIALIHQSPTCYGVSFPDLPGIITASGTLDEALTQAAEVLALRSKTGHRPPRAGWMNCGWMRSFWRCPRMRL